MFADDLVLLSLSKSELQLNINKLHDYCRKWRLKINIAKTKIMEFNKSGKICHEKFYLDNCEIECVKHYKYLGIIISSNGSFKPAVKHLKQKADKAFFALKSSLRESNLRPRIQLKIFDNVIKPILTYSSEIWGIENIKVNDLSELFNYCDKFEGEKLHLSACRWILACNKKTTKAAIRGETR